MMQIDGNEEKEEEDDNVEEDDEEWNYQRNLPMMTDMMDDHLHQRFVHELDLELELSHDEEPNF